MIRTVLETRYAVWRAYTRATGKESLPNPVPEPLDEFVTGALRGQWVHAQRFSRAVKPTLQTRLVHSTSEHVAHEVVRTVVFLLDECALWPTLSDVIGRRTTIVVCGMWMAVSVACFYLATSSLLVVLIQLAFGLVANAVWRIYYAAASDAAPEGAVSTANGIITTAMFVGGGITPLFMGKLISLSGGWGERGGYIVCFFVMSGCALFGVLLQLFTERPKHDSAQHDESASQESVAQ